MQQITEACVCKTGPKQHRTHNTPHKKRLRACENSTTQTKYKEAKIAKSHIRAKKSCNLIKSVLIFSGLSSKLRKFSDGSICILTKYVKIVSFAARSRPIKNVTERSSISDSCFKSILDTIRHIFCHVMQILRRKQRQTRTVCHLCHVIL